MIGRQHLDVWSFCCKRTVHAIFCTFFHCFVVIRYALWKKCVVNCLLCSMKYVLLVHIFVPVKLSKLKSLGFNG